ncbi:hypothetical protein [Bradyrhizobium sp. NAS96.2]|uniref:hypothetical protein n=1 Tax=Bradyrhizobium sp. NAS96.2 TaxID=1680160 RepID=UPI001AECB439|nr:hypothetical protein [Bradyrhizobium sp. NAS96.2]
MGLDMYAFAVADLRSQSIDHEYLLGQATELHYWRKHPDFHGWMERLYRLRGGAAEDFNCEPVQLTSADLDRLGLDILQNALPHTVGFFFGESDGSERDDDLAFVAEARQAIQIGFPSLRSVPILNSPVSSPRAGSTYRRRSVSIRSMISTARGVRPSGGQVIGSTVRARADGRGR